MASRPVRAARRARTILRGIRARLRELRTRPATAATLLVALLAAALVLLVGREVFAHLSANHDEGVYLQQAALLADGRLALEAGDLADAVRPWFFVEDGGRLYGKYQPGVPLLLAVGLATVGSVGPVLALVAAGLVLTTAGLAREAFDRWTGVAAAALLVTAPTFVFGASAVLSYAPTALFGALFALAYVRAHRRESLRYAALAGLAVGYAFLSRPYTAVLVALPFVVHASWTLVVALQSTDARTRWRVVRRQAVVAAGGLLFVAVTLAYNRALTGSALLFPYEAFAPRDGIGFGRRAILGHSRVYDPALALRANARSLWLLLTRWGPLGALGTALAAVGVAAGFRGAGVRVIADCATSTEDRASGGLPDRTVRLLLAGVFASVAAGNVYFWGTLNLLGRLEQRGDGLVALFGPVYHFDALVPLAVFGGYGAVVCWRRLRAATTARLDPRAARAVLLAALLVAVPVAGAVEAGALGPPLSRNEAWTETYASAYEPFEDGPPRNAVVFVPTPYGDWLNHPFQTLRNGAGLDGPTVYAMDRDAAGDLAVLDAFPDRTPYRFSVRGEWAPPRGDRVAAGLARLAVRRGDRVRVTTTVGVPEAAAGATVSLGDGPEAIHAPLDATDRESVTVTWVLGPDGAHLSGENETLRYDGPAEVPLSVRFVQPGGASITYRQVVTVEPTAEGVRVVWPPETRVCRLRARCGSEGTYLQDGGDYARGVRVAASATAVNDSGQRKLASPDSIAGSEPLLDGDADDGPPDGRAAADGRERGLPAALAVVDGHLADVVAPHRGPDEQLGGEAGVLGPLDGVEHLGAVGAHARGHVAESATHEDARQRREGVVAEAVQRGHGVGPPAQAVGAHHVRPVVDGREQVRQPVHGVGVVAVGGDDDGAVGLRDGPRERNAVPLGLLADDARAALAGYLGRAVAGAVDADHLGAAVGDALDVVEDGPDRLLLVVGPHHDGHVVEGELLRSVVGIGRVLVPGLDSALFAGPGRVLARDGHRPEGVARAT